MPVCVAPVYCQETAVALGCPMHVHGLLLAAVSSAQCRACVRPQCTMVPCMSVCACQGHDKECILPGGVLWCVCPVYGSPALNAGSVYYALCAVHALCLPCRYSMAAPCPTVVVLQIITPCMSCPASVLCPMCIVAIMHSVCPTGV
jgi:hypothetical protein